MSCKHGNADNDCEECQILDELWAKGFASGQSSFKCIGVIDAEGNIYPEPPEAGTQIFVKETK